MLLEYPLYPGRAFNLNAPYLLAQTEHFHPIVAGYSGFYTPGYAARVADLATFPARRRRRRSRPWASRTWCSIWRRCARATGQAAIAALDAVPWLEAAFADDSARVFRVKRTALTGAGPGR